MDKQQGDQCNPPSPAYLAGHRNHNVDPGQQEQSEYKPGQPGYPPEKHGQPGSPGYIAGQSGYQPGPPRYQAGQPGYQTGPPGYQPGQPGYQPGPPVYQAGQPGYQAGPNQPGNMIILEQEYVNNCMVLSVLSCLFGCCFLGIGAILASCEYIAIIHYDMLHNLLCYY